MPRSHAPRAKDVRLEPCSLRATPTTMPSFRAEATSPVGIGPSSGVAPQFFIAGLPRFPVRPCFFRWFVTVPMLTPSLLGNGLPGHGLPHLGELRGRNGHLAAAPPAACRAALSRWATDESVWTEASEAMKKITGH